jgi:hypothetical protein
VLRRSHVTMPSVTPARSPAPRPTPRSPSTRPAATPTNAGPPPARPVRSRVRSPWLSLPADGAGVESGAALADAYYAQAAPVVAMRVAAGGVRLAAVLERLFGR